MLSTVNAKVVGTVDNVSTRVPAWIWPAVVAVGCGAATLAVALVDPHTPGRWPTCPSLTLTGLYCPGCGSLRAVYSLTRLDFGGALSMNPMVFFAIPALVYLWALWLRSTLTDKPRKLAPAKYLWLLVGVVVLYAVLRNIPFFAPWLAPGA